VNARLIELLQRDKTDISAAWNCRLDEWAELAGERLRDSGRSAARQLLDDAIVLLEGGAPAATPTLPRPGARFDYHINLCQSVEVVLTGEVVVRTWAYEHMDLTDRQLVDTFEDLNRVFHQLIRSSTQRYCETCRANFENIRKGGEVNGS
jgi:hypothetical protein